MKMHGPGNININKNGVGRLLRSVWLSSDGEMMWYLCPFFCRMVGDVKVRWRGLLWGHVRQVSAVCEKYTIMAKITENNG
jgi:hypothetical protein